MYPNLKAEMARRKVTAMEIAQKVGITYGTFSKKMNGSSEFTMPQAFKIKRILGVDISLDELFKVEE